MDAPTDWTYGGQIDWSSPAKLKLLPVQMPLRCIIEALRERCSVIPYLPSILSTSFNPLATIKEYADAIQSAVTTLISYNRFARHTDEGRWGTIYSPAIPLWTEADLLTTIGATKRLVPDKLETLGEWLYQQYQILNLLRWTKRGAESVTETASNKTMYIGYGSWPSAWDAGTGSIHQHGGMRSDSGIKTRSRRQLDFSGDFTYRYLFSADNNFSIDVWIWLFTFVGQTGEIYSGEEYPVEGINYQKLGSVTQASPILWIGNIDSEPPTAPAGSGYNWNGASDTIVFPGKELALIRKFDAPGGFKFVE